MKIRGYFSLEEISKGYTATDSSLSIVLYHFFVKMSTKIAYYNVYFLNKKIDEFSTQIFIKNYKKRVVF